MVCRRWCCAAPTLPMRRRATRRSAPPSPGPARILPCSRAMTSCSGRGYFAAFAGRTINIHPSLLPRHGGAGMMGPAVHRAVIAAGDPETGVTIHEVTPELDAGQPLAQARVPVLPGEDAERLADRLLVTEHDLLLSVLAGLAAEGERRPPSVSMAAALPPGSGARATHERH